MGHLFVGQQRFHLFTAIHHTVSVFFRPLNALCLHSPFDSSESIFSLQYFTDMCIFTLLPPPNSVEWRPFSSTLLNNSQLSSLLRYTLSFFSTSFGIFAALQCLRRLYSGWDLRRDYLPDGMLRERSRQSPETQRFAVVIRWHPVQNHCTALFHVPSRSYCRDFRRSVGSSYLSFEVHTLH